MHELKSRDIAIFSAVSIFFVISIFSLITSNYYFVDDNARSIWGYFGWTSDGRPLTTITMMMLSNNGNLAQLGALPQILAIATMATAAVILQRITPWISAEKSVLILVLLFASPPYLMNLSFSFDALTMTVSAVMALFAALLSYREHWFDLRAVAASILALFTLSMYQPSINIFLCIVAVYSAWASLDNPLKALKRLAQGVSCFVIAYLGYKVVLIFSPLNDYGSEHSAMLPVSGLFTGLIHNIERMYGEYLAVSGERYVYGVGLFALSMIGWFAYRLKISTASTLSRAASLSLFIILMIAAWLTFAGIMLLLANPTTVPRVFMASGSFIAANLLYARIPLRRLPALIITLPLFFLLLYFMVYASAYSSSVKEYERYQREVGHELVHEVNTLSNQQHIDRIKVLGSLPYPASVINSIRSFPGIENLLVRPLANWYWGPIALLRYGMYERIKEETKEVTYECQGTVTTRNDMWQVRYTQELIIVDFRNICS